MGLISPTADRLSPLEREAWEYWATVDEQEGQHPYLVDLQLTAVDLLAEWCSYRYGHHGPSGHVSVSWGKDSVTVAHLSILAETGWPLVWVRTEGHENPDCYAVRDAFLQQFPDVEYHETWWEGSWSRSTYYQGRRRVVGVRADESAQRRESARTHGRATRDVCRPILHWSADNVFGYLARHDLPVHPAYAMTMDDTVPRSRPRVNMIRTPGHGLPPRAQLWREEWERRYYPEFYDGRNRKE